MPDVNRCGDLGHKQLGRLLTARWRATWCGTSPGKKIASPGQRGAVTNSVPRRSALVMFVPGGSAFGGMRSASAGSAAVPG